MHFAFYFGKYGNWQDKAIVFWTHGPYSHVELVFDNGESFSSSDRDGGTRFKTIDFIPGHWTCVDFQPTHSESEIRDWCKTQLGLKYDFTGVLGLSVGLNLTDKKVRWFCSEICSYIAVNFGTIKTKTNISPNKFFNVLSR